MKIFTLVCLLTSFMSQAQIITFSDDFNNGMSNWTLYNQDSLTPNAGVSYVSNAFVLTEDSDSTGINDSCATSTSWYDPIGQSDDWMVSPLITLGAANNYLFWDAKSEDPSFAESYEIWISTTGNTPNVFTDTSLADSAFYEVDLESPYWTRHAIELDSFAGQSIYIGFRNISNDKFLLLIDNVLVTENDPLTIAEHKNELILYPNPAHNLLYIGNLENNNQLIYFYGVDGRLVHKTQVSNQIDLSKMNPGLYQVLIGRERHTLLVK